MGKKDFHPGPIVQAILRALEGRKGAQTWLGEQIGKGQPAIHKYLKSGRIPAEELTKICDVLGLTIKIEGYEDPWELRYPISRLKRLYPIRPNEVYRISKWIDELLEFYEQKRGVAGPKVNAAKKKAAKKEAENEKNITVGEQTIS